MPGSCIGRVPVVLAYCVLTDQDGRALIALLVYLIPPIVAYVAFNYLYTQAAASLPVESDGALLAGPTGVVLVTVVRGDGPLSVRLVLRPGPLTVGYWRQPRTGVDIGSRALTDGVEEAS